ncbi:putative 26S proteasome regulatory subunit [Pleurotus pulmonarius]|nr:putative 26S proteasome regulatory subunit [Pleurotus pulmonarius]KAF4590835.1 putative 26S proteasome regulatory subunit [Pleurotus pulmonarius]
MGFTLPTATENPRDRANALISKKEDIESEIKSQLAILQANDSTIQSPLVDADGFPRADIDVWAVRTARVRIIELRNDLKDVTNEIGKVLETVYSPSAGAEQGNTNGEPTTEIDAPEPFARVDGVAPGSPAAESGMQREDLITKFGTLGKASFSSSSLQPLAELVNANEGRVIQIRVLRAGHTIVLSLTPRQGWGGRGMLGCHIVPYANTSR